jgi:hypothetical protein
MRPGPSPRNLRSRLAVALITGSRPSVPWSNRGVAYVERPGSHARSHELGRGLLPGSRPEVSPGPTGNIERPGTNLLHARLRAETEPHPLGWEWEGVAVSASMPSWIPMRSGPCPEVDPDCGAGGPRPAGCGVVMCGDFVYHQCGREASGARMRRPRSTARHSSNHLLFKGHGFRALL